MDPQQRVFLEEAWSALEHAGYARELYRGAVGVYAGAGGLMSSYLVSDVHVNNALRGFSGSVQHLANDKDYLTTRVSFKLNLRGPSVAVQSACSTSLVAVHMACQSLLAGECDIALAGGVSIRVPHKAGYLREEGVIFSPDGHCRPFSASAAGTLFGSGVGVVVLKRLDAARADKDVIHAVIRGTAINNDGASKVSFTASSSAGISQVIREALEVADVSADNIGYIEAHGTATALGDPVEIAGMTQAFRSSTAKTGFCGIGSVKGNVGHLEAAAGVAGLIKCVLALKHRMLPPSLHAEQPNPRIPFDRSPFFLN